MKKVKWNNIFKLLMLLLVVAFVVLLVVNNKQNEEIKEEFKDVVIKNVVLDEKLKITIEETVKELYCSTDKEDWVLVSENTCVLELPEDTNSYNIYFKNGDKIYKYEKDLSLALNVNKEKFYLAVGGKEELKINQVSINNTKEATVEVEDESVATYTDGVIKGIKVGTTNIKVSNETVTKNIEVVVTDLINVMPKEYKYNKGYIPCGSYTKSENELLDEILLDRVNTAGYQTRGAVVAVARFLTLEFPYVINYFSENGRMSSDRDYQVDGEGRYYHTGLYLTQSNKLDSSKIAYGPTPWGCRMYSAPVGYEQRNGLDCSGFTTWVAINAGFDIGDWGAVALTNKLGEARRITQELSLSDVMKPGDYLSEITVSEGHSAIIAGMDEEYIYVAESLWIRPYGVNLNKYKRTEFHKHFETVMLMDSVYKEEGNYENMWY